MKMKSIFEKAVREEILQRIESLTANHQPQWGKMSVAQMLRHCSLCEEYYFGNIRVGRSVLGRFLGKKALKSILRDEHSMLQQNAPTSAVFIVTAPVEDFDGEKLRWKSLVERYAGFDKAGFTHWFFGRMTRDELGQFVYKHSDHHLRQFGV